MRLRGLLLLTCAILLAGCSDPGGGEGLPSTSGSMTQDPMETMSRQPVTHEVSLQGNAFVPADLAIHVNDTVHWTHDDGVSPHNVESDAPAFDSHPQCTIAVPANPSCMTQGDEFSRKFDAAGVVDYRCEVHPGMTGTITVLAPDTPAPS